MKPMRKLTRKERGEIYLKAIDVLEYEKYICHAIALVAFGSWTNFKQVTSDTFPELFLMKPIKMPNNTRLDFGWFGYTDKENQQARIHCLLFAHAMTL
jgi:hypothetical protein